MARPSRAAAAAAAATATAAPAEAARAPEAPAVRTERNSRSTVTVACKLGVALFDLQLCEPKEIMENTQTGPRRITQYFPTGEVVRIRGTAYPRGTPPEGFPEKPEMVAGCALTRGVNKDFWEKWKEQHARAPYVVNGMIFAFEGDDHVKGRANEEVKIKSGLDPVKPGDDVRIPKSTNVAVSDPETEESRAKKMAKRISGGDSEPAASGMFGG